VTMRRVVFAGVAVATLLGAGEAAAQARFNEPDGGGSARAGVAHNPFPGVQRPQASAGYGGGFIELLITGRNPGPASRGSRATAAYGARNAFSEPAARRQVAALGAPFGDDDHGIRRVLDPRYGRQEVAYDGRHAAGTIVIHTPSKFLYLVQPGGRAIRYGIGVGRPGFTWAGMKTVSMKREWPSWTPPREMLKRRPDLPRHMVGGPANPLGARALYLGSSLYRIHGTNEPHTIGQSVSSGCIRMMNEDVVDLYERVRVGTKVLVI
jgi:lipoprotein-anchoring transpeptidase ErfK/SrfK